MQKAFVAIALALTLTCAFAYTSVNVPGYVKAPVMVANDTELNYTNASSIQLASVNIGELDLFAIVSENANTQNTSANTFNSVYRKLDGKALTASTNSTTKYTGGFAAMISYINGYAVALVNDNDTNSTPQISVYQTPLNGGAALARIFATSNTNVNNTPVFVSIAQISKTVYVFYRTNASTYQVNVTNFVVGGAKGSLEFTLSTTFNSTLNVVWGESLGSSQLFANWIDAGVLKDAQIDVSKGTVTVNTVGGWLNNFTCAAYATDKKWFGDICYVSNTTSNTTSFFVRSNTTSLAPLNTNQTNQSTFQGVYAYGPYIAIVYTDTSSVGNTTYSYDIWNLDTYVTYRNRTPFITTDSFATLYRVVSGGLYTLTYNIGQTVNGSYLQQSNIQVGLVLGSSSLTTVLGFILTIVAGLLLF